MPWHVLKSPLSQWQVMPSFLIGEWLFIACAVAALLHALSQPGEARRRHLLVWIGALVAGTANDAIFMALPLVDNFWQAQATIMLTPRMPLYIPCVYIWFMYVPTVAVWRLGLPAWARAPLAGLSAIVLYAPYDITGAKFLWWTWHDTDRPIANRLLGAPLGSTIWVITFVAAFSLLIQRMVAKEPLTLRRSLLALLVVALGSTPLMVLQMTALQELDGGTPGIRALVAVVLLYLVLVGLGLRKRDRSVADAARGPADRRLFITVAVHVATLALIMALFDPTTHRSTSVHQTIGPCHVEAIDITGAKRFEFLCAADYDEDFSFACLSEPPPDGARWYTVCGKPHEHFGLWLGAVSGLAALGMALFGWMLGARSPRAAVVKSVESPSESRP